MGPRIPTYSKAPTDLREPLPLDDSLTVESEPGAGRRSDLSSEYSFPGEHPLYPQVEELTGRVEELELLVKVGLWLMLALTLGFLFVFAVTLGILLALLT